MSQFKAQLLIYICSPEAGRQNIISQNTKSGKTQTCIQANGITKKSAVKVWMGTFKRWCHLMKTRLLDVENVKSEKQNKQNKQKNRNKMFSVGAKTKYSNKFCMGWWVQVPGSRCLKRSRILSGLQKTPSAFTFTSPCPCLQQRSNLQALQQEGKHLEAECSEPQFIGRCCQTIRDKVNYNSYNQLLLN